MSRVINITGSVAIIALVFSIFWGNPFSKPTISWMGSEMPIVVDGIEVSLPDGGIGEQVIGSTNEGGLSYKWTSANKQLHVNIVNHDLTVNGVFYGSIDSNDHVEIQYGPIVLVNGEIIGKEEN